jgi:hypothetical protein
MPPAEFEPAIPASKRPQTQALDRTATGMCVIYLRSKFQTLGSGSSLVVAVKRETKSTFREVAMLFFTVTHARARISDLAMKLLLYARSQTSVRY